MLNIKNQYIFNLYIGVTYRQKKVEKTEQSRTDHHWRTYISPTNLHQCTMVPLADTFLGPRPALRCSYLTNPFGVISLRVRLTAPSPQ